MPIKQHLLLLLALFAFIGQSIAAVQVSCSAMDMEGGASADMVHMDHSMHGMQSQNDQPESAGSCCGDLECTMLQCGILFSAIVDAAVSSSPDLLSASLIDTRVSDTSSDVKSLFRPPIAR